MKTKQEFLTTTDINLATYLQINKFEMTIVRKGNRCIFKFTNVDTLNEYISRYYDDYNGIRSFANALKDMKTRIADIVR